MTFLSLASEDHVRSKDIDTLKRFIRYKLGGYRVSINFVRPGQVFYRGVRCEERPNNIGRVSYPPAHLVTKLGRANRSGVSMFYCSAAAAAVFYELRAKKGDCIAVSKWEVVEPLWMHHLGFHQDALQRMGDVGTTMRPRLTNPIPNEPKNNARLRRQLSLAFTQDVRDGDDYKYKQSIAINELLFDGASPIGSIPNGPPSGRVAGTAYPAMQMKGAADNAAIWPEFVDSSMKIKSVGYALVEAVDEARSSFTILTLANTHTFDGRGIIWSEVASTEIERRQHIALEDNEWVLRDGHDYITHRH